MVRSVYTLVLSYISTLIGIVFLKTTTIMSTKNLPLVATAGDPPAATGGTVLNVAAEVDTFDQEEFVDNYDLDVDRGDDYTLGSKNGALLRWKHLADPLDCLQGLPSILYWYCNQQDANNDKTAQRGFVMFADLPWCH
jgi:hypothetical protein